MDLSKKAIRVGIAASLCLLVSNLLNLKFPFFVLLPAVMPISTFFGETIKFGVNRIIGSTIGAAVGVLLTMVPSNNVLLAGIGVILIVYVCDFFKWGSTTSIACLVFAAIIVGVKGASAFEYSVHRLLATFIGIGITTLVNHYIFNPDLKHILKNQGENIQKELLTIANSKDFNESEVELKNIQIQLSDMRGKFKIYSEEFKHASKYNSEKSKIEKVIATLSLTFDQAEIINYINSNKELNLSLTQDNTDLVISYHKDLFFMEMKNLNKLIENI